LISLLCLRSRLDSISFFLSAVVQVEPCVSVLWFADPEGLPFQASNSKPEGRTKFSRPNAGHPCNCRHGHRPAERPGRRPTYGRNIMQSRRFIVSTPMERTTMKLTTIALAGAFALTSTFALAAGGAGGGGAGGAGGGAAGAGGGGVSAGSSAAGTPGTSGSTMSGSGSTTGSTAGSANGSNSTTNPSGSTIGAGSSPSGSTLTPSGSGSGTSR
jgi:hypothetical protein